MWSLFVSTVRHAARLATDLAVLYKDDTHRQTAQALTAIADRYDLVRRRLDGGVNAKLDHEDERR